MSEGKHTPGLLAVDFGGTLGHIKIVTGRDDGKTPTVARYDTAAISLSDEEKKANAHRLVAAWNSCDSIPTSALENGVVGELLAALKVLVDRNLTYLSGKVMGDQITYAEVKAARDVLAKIEGDGK